MGLDLFGLLSVIALPRQEKSPNMCICITIMWKYTGFDGFHTLTMPKQSTPVETKTADRALCFPLLLVLRSFRRELGLQMTNPSALGWI